MSLLVFGLIAAACGASALAASAVMRRRFAPPALPPPGEVGEPSRPAPDPYPELPAFIDHVIQVGDDTRWPRSGMLLRSGDTIRAAILVSEEGEEQQATVALPPPDRSLLWLREVVVAMPPSLPTRIEVDGFLLDREELLPVTLEAVGRPHPRVIEGEAQLGRYRGHTGDAALALAKGGEVRVWYGPVLDPGEFDSLGRVDDLSS